MTNYNYIPVAKPCIGEEEINAVTEVLKSGMLSLGPNVSEFEEKFAAYIGAKHACSVSSGTAGLHMCVIAADIKQGDEVITSPFSFISSANSILFEKANPVFVDIDEESFNMDPEKIEAAITPKTKAILVVHIFGHPADMDPIMAIAKKHNLTVIEDACESIGATYKGKMLGTFGNPAVFAFYPNKQMTTGEGGIIVTDDPVQQNLFKSLCNQGRSDDGQWLRHTRLGYNYRLDGLSCAVGIEQLKKIEFLLSEKEKIADKYNELLKDVKGISLIKTKEGCTRSWFVYVIQLDKNIDRNKVIEEMNKRKIATKPYLPSIHLQPLYKEMYGYKEGDFPISESISSSTLALPFYIGITDEELKTVCENIKEVIIG